MTSPQNEAIISAFIELNNFKVSEPLQTCHSAPQYHKICLADGL
jgi:hypothetical protein